MQQPFDERKYGIPKDDKLQPSPKGLVRNDIVGYRTIAQIKILEKAKVIVWRDDPMGGTWYITSRKQINEKTGHTENVPSLEAINYFGRDKYKQRMAMEQEAFNSLVGQDQML